MELGTLDLDTRFEYLIIYRNKNDNTINTWTLGFAFKSNYKSMLETDYVEILGVYKKMSDKQLKDIVSK